MSKTAENESAYNALGAGKLYNDIAWTHKIHEEQADIYSSIGRWLQVISIACIALTAVLAGVSIGVDYAVLNVSATVFAVISAFVAIYREAKPYDALVCEHSTIAKDYLALREEFEEALTENPLNKSAVHCIRCKYVQICEHAPRTTNMAVNRAERAFKNNEEKTFDELFGECKEESE